MAKSERKKKDDKGISLIHHWSGKSYQSLEDPWRVYKNFKQILTSRGDFYKQASKSSEKLNEIWNIPQQSWRISKRCVKVFPCLKRVDKTNKINTEY